MSRGELNLAQRLDQKLVSLSRQRDERAGLVLGHYSSGRNQMLAGRFVSSRSHLEQTLALYDRFSHRSLMYQSSTDPHAMAQGALGLVLFCLGLPDRAMASSNAAIMEARRLAHPPSLAQSLAFAARLILLWGDDAALNRWTEELAALSTEQGFAHLHATAVFFRGWLKVKNGDLAEGISFLRSASTIFSSAGAVMWAALYTAPLASASEAAGQVEEARMLLDDALQAVERTGMRWYAAELNRHKGELLLREGKPDAAEELYHKALGIAREQEAKLWELRAAASLARLRRDHGRRAEARDLLAPVYGWFTEGFEAPDLKDAKVLLDQLA
jgi:predicted ATPase